MNSVAVARVSGRLSDTANAIRGGLREHAVLHTLALTVLSFAVAESIWLGRPLDFSTMLFFSLPLVILLALMIFAGLVMEIIRFARRSGDGSITLHIARELRDNYMAPKRISNAVHVTLFMSVFLAGYENMRESIPLANPYSWDQTFMNWDRVVHLGRHPYEWLAPLLNYPMVTAALNINYNMWFAVMFGCWFWQGYGRFDTNLRLRFLFSFGLTWFLGTCVLGTIFSSVGPCFYGKLLTGPDPFAPLMAYLQDTNKSYHIYALNAQRALWKYYTTGNGAIRGITAMPSMHVGASVLFAMLGLASGKRWLAWLLAIFATLIMVGSVHLGWHYAIDGYAGAALAVLCWWISGRIVAWDRQQRGGN